MLVRGIGTALVAVTAAVGAVILAATPVAASVHVSLRATEAAGLVSPRPATVGVLLAAAGAVVLAMSRRFGSRRGRSATR
jgi:hypothetical protein